MPDVYATIETADPAVQERLADVLEMRAADRAQQAMRDDYLDDLALPDGARVLEIGSGTGAVTRALAARPGVAEAVGLDPSPIFVERARALAAGLGNVSFETGDGRELPFADDAFDAVVCHTVLCHIPGVERVLEEAARVAPQLAVFDGDYATTTVAIGENDPLQACADATIEALVHDRFLMRRISGLVRAAGWEVQSLRSHGYLETDDPGYTLTLVDRGADVLAAAGRLRPETAEAIKREARERDFYGFIGYVSLIARRS